MRGEIVGGREDTTAPHTMTTNADHPAGAGGLPWVVAEHPVVAQGGTQAQELIQSHWSTQEELQGEVAAVGPPASKGGTRGARQGVALGTRALQGALLGEASGMPRPSMMNNGLILVASSIFCTGIQI